LRRKASVLIGTTAQPAIRKPFCAKSEDPYLLLNASPVELRS